MIIYEIKPNDTIYAISQRYNITPGKILADNQIANPEHLVVGQTLVLFPEDTLHKVARGESFASIAKKYGLSQQELQLSNPQLRFPYRLLPGMQLAIPRQEAKRETIDVNGYTFPGISMNLLQSIFPYLTYLSIFSYHSRPNGTLIPIDDIPLIQAARRAGVAPMMVVTNMSENAGFSTELAHTLLTDKQIQNTYIRNIMQTLKSKNYYGLDVDFEYVLPEDRDNYNSFLRELRKQLSPQGYILTTALAPKSSSDQKGLLYEAHDYPVHGMVADHVILMTYEWGYTKGPAMAVAPINQVKKVLDYATSVIPAKKILLGIPTYGYDWTLPYIKGSSARSFSSGEGPELAFKVKADIQYDPISQAPFFHYFDEEKQRHEVWFDDARSIEAKLKLISEYNLGGASYWTIGRSFPQNWLLLRSMYNIRKVL